MMKQSKERGVLMKTKKIFMRAWAWIMILLLAAPPGTIAQQSGDNAVFKQEELDQLLAPIALYPDDLLSQIFMASTYPLEVVEASRWAKQHQNLKGDALAQVLEKQDWDPSVRSLVNFPDVLSKMSEKLDWTQKLGDAFISQQKDVMDAVQRLRAKAEASGNLKTTEQQKVIVEEKFIKIEPTSPQTVYVPTYNPTVVYGAWPYPAYPPYAYYPPGYVAGTALLSFGVGMAVGGALWGNCNWGHGDVDVNVNNYNNYTKNVNTGDIGNKRAEQYQGNRGQGGRGQGQGQWQHNPEHRKGAQYRDASTQQRFNKAGAGNVQSREAFRGRAAEGRQEMGRGGMQQGTLGGNRASQGAVGAGRGQPSQLGGGGGQFGGGQAARGPGAFDGVGQGRATTMDSARGRSSRESFGASSAGRGGGGGSSVQRGGGGGGGGRAGGGGGGGGGGRGGGGRGRR